MNKNRESISQGRSYQEIGEYWDKHDLAEVWDQTEPVEVEVAVRPLTQGSWGSSADRGTQSDGVLGAARPGSCRGRGGLKA